jgi:DNA-directed RNA polymerase specialized sigma24 family protein
MLLPDCHILVDNRLMECFRANGDEVAFDILVKRHGSMVLGVCQSVLHLMQDAEDLFQAACLLLAKKAGSIHRGEAVTGWLYRVVYHLG